MSPAVIEELKRIVLNSDIINEDDSQLFEITFKIVLSSMLQNEQKFHTFLLGEH